MTSAIDKFLAAVRSHPVIAQAVASDHEYAAHLDAFERALVELTNSDNSETIAAHDKIAEIVRTDGVESVTRAKIEKVMRALQRLQAAIHGTPQ